MRGWQRAGQARRALRRVDLHMFALMFGVKYAILVKPIGATIVDQHGRHGGSADLAANEWPDCIERGCCFGLLANARELRH